ncbi:MAG: F510_1955 family glycosylhydrolase [Ectobacillus sp.]
MKRWLTSGIIITSLLTFTACSNGQEGAPKEEKSVPAKQAEKKQEAAGTANPQDFYNVISSGKIDHVHGIGYPGNMPGITIATHEGLKVYQDGKWLETKGQNNDYMGFQATKDGFYASGHPEEGSSLKNPLGLVKSTDGGKTLKQLAFYGESDFHYLAVGYNSHSMYLFNEQGNSKLKKGFYYSADEGKSWKQSKLTGLSAAASMFAVHPDKASVIAMSTKEGIFLSTDYGNTFKLFSDKIETSAITIGAEDLIYSYTKDKKQGLIKQSFATSQTVEIALPALDTNDHIMYVAQNPKAPSEIAFVTMNTNVFVTADDGKSWKQIAKKGAIQ